MPELENNTAQTVKGGETPPACAPPLSGVQTSSTATPPPLLCCAPSQADARPTTLKEERAGKGERSSPTHRDMPGMKCVIGHELPPPAPCRTSLAFSATAPSGNPSSSSSAIAFDGERLLRSDAERRFFRSECPGFVRLRRFDGLGEAPSTREAPPPAMTLEPSTVILEKIQ